MGATALVALALAACGSATTGTTATTAPASTATTTAQAATPAATAQEATPAPAATTAQGSTAATTAAKLNLNTLTQDQLMSTIPNFPSRMVREFMEYRPYISIQQFRKEIGKYVDAAQVATYEQYVYVPISVNDADAATLQQIPGVSAAIADQLIAARPYASNDAFLAKLTGLVPSANSQQAAALLATS